MAKRGHAADGVAGGGADGVGVGALDLFAADVKQRGQLARVELVLAGDEGHDRRAGDGEDQALDDLADLAADGRRGVVGRARRLLEGDDVNRQPQRRRRVGHLLGGWM